MLKIWTRTGILWVAQLFMAFHYYSRWEWWVLICSHLDWILHRSMLTLQSDEKSRLLKPLPSVQHSFFFRSTVMLSSHSFFGLLQVSDTKPFEHWKKNILFSNCAKTWTHHVYCISLCICIWHICLIILQNMNKPHVSIQLILCFSHNSIAVQ